MSNISDEELAALLGDDATAPAAPTAAPTAPAAASALEELEAIEVAQPQPAAEVAAKAPEAPPKEESRPAEAAQPKPQNDNVVKQYVDPRDVRRDVTIGAGNIEQDLIEHSALVAYYGSQMAHARRQRDRIKTSLEIGEARIAETIRGKYAAEGTKITEARVEQLVRIDARYAALRQMLDDANAALAQAEIAVEAFRQRSSMLIQLSAGERVERAGDLANNRIANSAANAMSAIRNRQSA